jgi:hypothetical protein
MEEFDKDYVHDFLSNIEKIADEEIELTEENLELHIKAINKSLKTIEERLKAAEEEGDESLYNMELNRKQLILQRLNDLNILTEKIKR